MAKYRFRGALAAAQFPLSTNLAGRTVLEGRLDQDVKAPPTSIGQPTPTQFNTPQLLYAENMMPTSEGCMSVRFQQFIAGLAGVTVFDQAITIRDEDENNYLFAPAQGRNYFYDPATGLWNSVNPIAGWTGRLVTRAYVNGRTFICYEGIGIYEYDGTLNTFTKQTLVGITDAEVRGIGASSNYLIAFTDLEVLWSSLVDPLDFTPSYDTGAGRSIPQDVKARITAVLGISGGFIIYTAKNAVAAIYTNNVRAPFTFKEIANAGGIQTYEQVTSEQTSGAQYAWTTGGLQKITVQSAEPVSPEINDFIAGRMWDEWDPVAKRLKQHYTTAPEFPVKLAFISSRYVVLSYSTAENSTAYQWAIVIDTVLKRWGKLKIDHVDCFSYPYPNVRAPVEYQDLMNTTYADLMSTRYIDLINTGVISDPPSKLTIAFLQENGAVQMLRMDYNKEEQENAVLIFGKFQLTRSKLFGLQLFELEGIYGADADQGVDTLPMSVAHPVTVTALAARKGYTIDKIEAMKLLVDSTKFSRYARRIYGVNVSVAVEGTMALSTYMVEGTEDGDR